MALTSLTASETGFTANVGQWPDSVLYRANPKGATMWFTRSGVYFQFTRPVRPPEAVNPRSQRALSSNTHSRYECLLVKEGWVNANPAVEVAAEDPIDYRFNYFLGNDASKWRAAVPCYSSIVYRNVYPGIDITYRMREGKLEYDLIAATGANLSQVRFQYQNIKSLHVDKDGQLLIATGWGDVSERGLPSQFKAGETASPFVVTYELFGDLSFGFATSGQLDPNFPLLVGPSIGFSTYLGGSGADDITSIAVDSSGNAYVTGQTSSADFPTQYAYDPDYEFGYVAGDIFVTKFNLAGSDLVYSTYIGGINSDGASGIAVDTFGSAYVTGLTSSWDFPTANAYDATFAGDTLMDIPVADAFLTKLPPDGSALVYSTFFGGPGEETGQAVACDEYGAAYVVGSVDSTGFPVVNALQGNHNGGRDAFVMKFVPSGASLIYSTYLGGDSLDQALAVAIDRNREAYVTGYTHSDDFPTIIPFNATRSGGADAFVTRFTPTGQGVYYSTFFGGSGDDFGESIAVDDSGRACIAGWTDDSTGFPIKNAYDSVLSGDVDAFIAELSPIDSLVFSTFLGGSGIDQAYTVALDSASMVFIAGSTESSNFPCFNATDGTLGGSTDAFLTKLLATGDVVAFSTYLGGSDMDLARALALGDSSNVFVAGATTSEDFSTANPFQSDFGGFLDGFVTKITGLDCPLLRVPRIYQTDSAWSSETYDGADTIASMSPNPTIGALGCALTGLAMVIRSFGVAVGADSLPVNPLNLNNWLNTHAGYVYPASVDWTKVAEYTAGQVVFVESIHRADNNQVDADLENGRSVLLEYKYRSQSGKQNQHFVLARGKSNCVSYDINDPAHSDRQSLSVSPYHERYHGFRRFAAGPTQKELSVLFALHIASVTAVELAVNDSTGGTTGYDPVGDTILEQCDHISYYKDLVSEPPLDDDTLADSSWRLPGATTSLYFFGVTRPLYQISLYSEDSSGYRLYIDLSPSPSVSSLSSSVSGPLPSGQSRRIWIAPIDNQTPAAVIVNLGDVDLTGAVDIGDLEGLVSFLYTGSPEPQPVVAAGDVTCDGLVDISDLMYLVDFLFQNGPPPQCPY